MHSTKGRISGLRGFITFLILLSVASVVFLYMTATIFAVSIEEVTSNQNTSIPVILTGTVDITEEDDSTVIAKLSSNNIELKEDFEIPIEYIQYDSQNFQKLKESGALTSEDFMPISSSEEIIVVEESIEEENSDDEVVVISTEVDVAYVETEPLLTTEHSVVEAASPSDIVMYFNGLPVTLEDINLSCQMVQHELGHDKNFFPGYDFNFIQTCEIAVIWNRYGKRGMTSMRQILLEPKQFITSLDEISGFDPYEPITRANVLKFLRGEASVKSGLICSMSWPYDMDVNVAVAKTEKLAGFKFRDYEIFYANCGSFKQLCVMGCE